MEVAKNSEESIDSESQVRNVKKDPRFRIRKLAKRIKDDLNSE